ncbi:2-octaprenyl-6-methoxyphenol hydroxylase [Tatumella ptyseos ATCC 33301]|uniref:2-octaprenyl-6-methoxyphenol hydroxylase n=3 Tax=Tatumella ptyseos TaxID=82987 RepID=A0A085J9U2_9GAMM|nr:2-octaprenyl-6-methoxyphenol hydroxylase [Tatumella ptyseos ATCC 33301]
MIIAGGGMAGATLALAVSHLTQGKLPVTLIEATTPGERGHPGFDGRAIALAAGTCQQLEQIGVWSHLAGCATPITDIHVSDRGFPGHVGIRHDEYGLPALGNVVELHDAGQQLFSRLKHAPGVTVICPARAVSVSRTAEQVTVTLDNGEQHQAKLLVVANGSGSSLAAGCGVRWQQEDYQQIAVIANVRTSELPAGRAYERFTPHGPLALLPMSGDRYSLVWCHPAEMRAQVEAWSEQQFLDELQKAFGWRQGRFIRCGKRDYYPLVLQQAQEVTRHRLVVAGNAAQTLHPIAGQGFNLGLRDVMTLAETVARASAAGEDIGDYATLQRYRERREPDRQKTIAITDGLVRLFSNRNLPLVAGRNIGLTVMDKMPWLKHQLAGRTLGWVKR